MNMFIHCVAWLRVIKSTIQAKEMKKPYNYFSQCTWKCKCCSSLIHFQTASIRPLIGAIITTEKNGMTTSWSGIHTLTSRSHLLLLPTLTRPKRTIATPGKGQQNLPVEDNYPKKNAALHLADEIFVRRKKKWRGKKKKSQSNYCDPEEIWKLSR